MAIYTEKMTWASTTIKGRKVELKMTEADVNKGVLHIILKSKFGKEQYSVELYNGEETNKQIREVVKAIVEHFDLSYAEQNAIRRDIRHFVTR